jgi:fatty acid desaturase
VTVIASTSAPSDIPALDFAALRREVKAAGLLAPRPMAYLRSSAWVLVALLACWFAVVKLGTSWWQLLVAGALGVVWTQIGFLGHDAAHHQVLRGSRAADVLGLITANLSLGLSHTWWAEKHNAHHAHPNDLQRDPDVGLGAIVFDAGQAAGRRGVARWIARHQGALFMPLLTLEGLNLQVASVRSLLRRPGRGCSFELGLLALHHAVYVSALLLLLPLPQAVAFFGVHQAMFGLYLGMSFAPNHKGMPLLTDKERADHLRTQVLTSRNVRGGLVVDVLLGGLNYQVEHHLFPMMPRHSLRSAQPLVRAFCARAAVTYTETGLFESYRMALAHLHAVGAPLRAERRGSPA